MKTLKILVIFVHELVNPIFVGAMTIFTGSEYAFHVILLFSFAPELGVFLSKSFRNWIQEGIEDGDGVLNSKDIRDGLSHYAALNCIRIFTISASASIFQGVHVPDLVFTYSFAGAMGIESILALKSIFRPNLKTPKAPD